MTARRNDCLIGTSVRRERHTNPIRHSDMDYHMRVHVPLPSTSNIPVESDQTKAKNACLVDKLSTRGSFDHGQDDTQPCEP